MARIPTLSTLLLLFGAVPADAAPPVEAGPAKQCSVCEAWNRPQVPFRIFANTYYVGTKGLSAVLVTSPDGHVLLDGALPQSAPLIAANIETLGFRLEDVRVIANSHSHFDHAGGIAALQRASGAEAVAGEHGAAALRQGGPVPGDPQFAFGLAFNGYPAVETVRGVADGETVRVGDLAVTAHYVPGHTPGSTTWTWTSCADDVCHAMVYADSLNAVSAPGFRFSGGPDRASRVAPFRKSIAKVAALPCDILMTVHPEFMNVTGKLEARAAGADENPFVDPTACQAYAAAASARLDKRLADEKTAASTGDP